MAEKDNDTQSQPVRALKATAAEPGGFFAIQRRGQGKWTRIGTAVGSAIVILATALFIYHDIGANVALDQKTVMIIAAVFVLVASLFAFWIQNRPNNVTFLVDTDSEMKKVNWTSRQELIGSTKVVIFFMFALAAMLFIVDLIFGYLFYGLGVLKVSPGLFGGFLGM